MFVFFSQSKHLLKNPMFHSKLGPFPAQRPLVLDHTEIFFLQKLLNQLFLALEVKENGCLSFVYGLYMKNPPLHSVLNTQCILFNLPIPYVSLILRVNAHNSFVYHLFFTRTMSVSLPLVIGFWAQLASSDRLLSTQLEVRIMCTPVLECISVFSYQKGGSSPAVKPLYLKRIYSLKTS